MTKETKVGLFVLIGVAMLMSLSTFLRNVDVFGGGTFPLTFYVDDGTGFVPNSNIKYRGIDVGKIYKVEVDPNGMIAIRVKMNEDMAVPANAKLRLAQNGILGGRYAELFLEEAPAAAAMGEGDEYYNYKPSPTMSDLTTEITNLTRALNASIGTEQAQEDIRQTLSNLRETTEGLKLMINRNQEQIASIVTNIDKVSSSLGDKSEEIKLLIDNFYAMSGSMRNFSENLDGMLDSQDSDINATIANLRELTENAKGTLAKIDNVSGNLVTTTEGFNDGTGTLGMLMTDNETRDQLKDTIASLSDMMEKANNMVIQLEGGAESLTKHGEFLGNVNLQIMPNDRKLYYFAISNNPWGRTMNETTEYTKTDNLNPANNEDYTEEKKRTEEGKLAFSIQYGYSFFENHLRFRAGLFDSQIGFAADWFPLNDKSLRVSVEGSDFFRDEYDGYYRAYARYWLFDHHLYLHVGMDDIGSSERRSFSIGAGITIVDNDLKTLLGAASLGSIGQ